MSAAPQRELRGASAGAVAVLVDRGSDELVGSAVSAVRGAGLDGRVVLLCAPGRSLGSEVRALGVEVAEVSGPAQALAVLADVAATGPTSLAVHDTALVARPVALLDVLDRPRAKTMAWVVEDRDKAAVIGGDDPSEVWPRVRHSPGRGALVESVASPVHHVGVQTGWAVGLLRLAPADLPAAVAAWRAATTVLEDGLDDGLDESGDDGLDGLAPTYALALVSLTRAGLRISAELLGGWRIGCASGPSTAAAALAAGGPQPDDWRTRLVEARRPVDGLYSTFVVRAVSRRITWRLLPTGISPNAVTVFSFGLGILAAVLCAVGGYAALVAAAVILQVSLVLDCVDGEIARYTRRYSPLGAWLDVTGDRIKEYGVFAGLAISSTRAGNDIWWLALLALALVAYRHFVDYGYGVTVRAAHVPVVAVLPLDQRDDGPDPRPRRAAGRLAGVISATDSTSSRAVVHWAKKALHLPIGERYLLLSLTMLTGKPELVLAVLVVLEVPSVLYTTPGRVLRSVSGG